MGRRKKEETTPQNTTAKTETVEETATLATVDETPAVEDAIPEKAEEMPEEAVAVEEDRPEKAEEKPEEAVSEEPKHKKSNAIPYISRYDIGYSWNGMTMDI